MNRWTRKRRLKFRKRWRKQHGGHNFTWFRAEYVYAVKPFDGEMDMIFFKREPTFELGIKLKEG